jgi:hypothetical protein
MEIFDRLNDYVNGRPKEVGDVVRHISLGRSRKIRDTGTHRFQTFYGGDWYGILREAYGALVEHPIPYGTEREMLRHVTDEARKVLEDNRTPIVARDFPEDEMNKVIVGPLNQVLHFNGRTVLDDGSILEITPTPYDVKLTEKTLPARVEIDREVDVGDSRFTDIQWQLDYRIMQETFGDTDDKGNDIEEGERLWFSVASKRKDRPMREALEPYSIEGRSGEPYYINRTYVMKRDDLDAVPTIPIGWNVDLNSRGTPFIFKEENHE